MIGDGIVALLGCEIMLDIYGFYQNTCDIVSMLKKSYKKSKLYKFLIFGGISSSLNYLLKCIVMTWLLIDWNVESCFYFALGFSFTEFLNLWFLFGISSLRFIAVVKKKVFMNLDKLEDGLWKFLFPVFFAIFLSFMFTISDSMATLLQQVKFSFSEKATKICAIFLMSLTFTK